MMSQRIIVALAAGALVGCAVPTDESSRATTQPHAVEDVYIYSMDNEEDLASLELSVDAADKFEGVVTYRGDAFSVSYMLDPDGDPDWAENGGEQIIAIENLATGDRLDFHTEPDDGFSEYLHARFSGSLLLDGVLYSFDQDTPLESLGIPDTSLTLHNLLAVVETVWAISFEYNDGSGEVIEFDSRERRRLGKRDRKKKGKRKGKGTRKPKPKPGTKKKPRKLNRLGWAGVAVTTIGIGAGVVLGTTDRCHGPTVYTCGDGTQIIDSCGCGTAVCVKNVNCVAECTPGQIADECPDNNDEPVVDTKNLDQQIE